MDKIRVLTFWLLKSFKANESRFCLWSNKTAAKVESCPESEKEMEDRAKAKDCDSVANSQNCTTHSKFKYHCLINEFENAFIEVYAESYFILSGKLPYDSINWNVLF